MERLTMRNGLGEAITNPHIRKNGHKRCLEKLAHYEDLAEQGRLMELPCAVGERTYQVVTKWYRINKGGCTCCTTACGSNCACDYFEEKDGQCTNTTANDYWQIISKGFKLEDFWNFGETVFLIKAEAEKKLADMQKG